MTHYIGLDAHSKTCTAVVISEAGKLTQSKTFDTSEGNLISFVKSVPRPRKLAFEEMNIAHWLFLSLNEHVDELIVAHAPHLPKQRGAKNDLPDALRLAEELRAGRLTAVFHEGSKLWELRSIVYSYLDFTTDLTRAKVRYKSFLRARGIPATGDGVYTDTDILKKLEGDAEHFVAVNLFEHVRAQQEIKDSYEEKFAKLAKEWTVINKLCSIPGISTVRASIIAAIICSPHRFVSKHELWAYAKLVRYIDKSDGRIYGSRATKGRPELKCVFMGAATCALQHKNSLRQYYDQLRSRGLDDRKAKKAVARRIAAIILMIMKKGKRYDDKYQEKRRRLETSKA